MPAKLLVADDSTTIQKVFEKTFPAEEFTLSFATNGEEALTKAREERPQVVIADINMPLKNGFELCEGIKKDQALRGIPVLLLIGILDDFDENESRRVGADGFIVKPFEAHAAINKVRAVLAKGGNILPAEEPAGGSGEEILELADVIQEPSVTPPPVPQTGEEETFELTDIIQESPATPSSFPKPGEEEIFELADIIKESPTQPSPPPQDKGEGFVLDTPLRELEAELKAEFPEGKEAAEEAPLFQEERQEESLGLDLDLPFDQIEPEPQAQDTDWTRLFGDLGSGGTGQEVKDERLGTILDESATELEKIEGLSPTIQENTQDEFTKKFREPFFGEVSTELDKIEGLDLNKGASKGEEEFAEKFMDGFEPVFEREEAELHIDILEKDEREAPTEKKDDLEERVAAAVSHELKTVMEEVIRNKVPQLVRQEIERLKKE